MFRLRRLVIARKVSGISQRVTEPHFICLDKAQLLVERATFIGSMKNEAIKTFAPRP